MFCAVNSAVCQTCSVQATSGPGGLLFNSKLTRLHFLWGPVNARGGEAGQNCANIGNGIRKRVFAWIKNNESLLQLTKADGPAWLPLVPYLCLAAPCVSSSRGWFLLYAADTRLSDKVVLLPRTVFNLGENFALLPAKCFYYSGVGKRIPKEKYEGFSAEKEERSHWRWTPCIFDELKDGAGCVSAWVCRAAGTELAAFCLPGWHGTWEPVMFLLSLLLLPQHLFVHWWPELRSWLRCPVWSWVGILNSQTQQHLIPNLAGVWTLLAEPPAWQKLLLTLQQPHACCGAEQEG